MQECPGTAILVESKTRKYHGRVGSGRMATWRSGVGKTGYEQNCPPRGQASLVLSKASKTRRLNDSPPVESKTRTYPGRVGTGRPTARRRGRAGTGSTGRRRRDCSPRGKQTLLSPRQWKNVLGVPQEERTKENILCKPAFDPRLITVLYAGREALFVPGC